MRTLYLLRHAKAEAGDAATADPERALSEAGREAAKQMGAWMKRHGMEADLVLCSTAQRTRQTCDLTLAASGMKPEIRHEKSLYLASPGDMLRLIQNVPDDVRRLMVIGHNPGMHNLAIKLVDEGRPEAIELLEQKFPTAALAVLEFQEEGWEKVAPGSGFLAELLTPKTIE